MPRIKQPDTDQKLESETRKWLSRLENKLKSTIHVSGVLEDRVTKNAMENVNAYIKDCNYFLEKRDFVRAFEAIIYAWGIYETLKRLGLLVKASKN